jgi:hypothetical protein
MIMIVVMILIMVNHKLKILREISLAVPTGTSFICYGKKNCWAAVWWCDGPRTRAPGSSKVPMHLEMNWTQ